MYKAVFIDIDGTLVDKEKKISEDTKKSIKEAVENGVEVVICSGRQRVSAEPFKDLCNMSRYIINSNGAEIYDSQKQEILYECSIDSNECKKLYNLAVKDDMIIKLNFSLGRTINKLEYIGDYEIELKNEESENFINRNKITQMSICSEDIVKFENIKKYIIENKFIKIANEFIWKVKGKSFYTIHCTNKNASKGNAIAGLCKCLNIDLKDTIAIGDGKNDISMMKIVGLGVAMNNSLDEVKRYADVITTSNEEDGVAKVFEKIVKEN